MARDSGRLASATVAPVKHPARRLPACPTPRIMDEGWFAIPSLRGGNMRIANAGRIAVVALLSIAGAACNRSAQSKELTVLENAYKSGVLSKAEYEVKRAALETQSAALTALDRALEAGVFTKDEYQARKAQLIAKAGALAALDRAHNAGVLTKDEYLAKRSARSEERRVR